MPSVFQVVISAIACVVPFILAIVVALRPGVRPRSPNDYFLYNRNLTSSEFLKTSVGYSLQAAAIFLFLYWTIVYGLWSLIVPIAWGGGYIVAAFAVKFGLLDKFLTPRHQEIRTIHGFVGETATQNSAPLVIVMAISTIIGLGGTMIAELDYASAFLLESLGIYELPGVERIAHIAILAFAGFYVLWGGFKAVVETDRVQVPLSYICIGIATFGCLYAGKNMGKALESKILILCVVILFLVLFLNRWVFIARFERSYESWRDGALFIVLAITGLIFFLIPGTQSELATAAINTQASAKSFMGFGLLGVISLTLANGIWQFIDISSLQRLQSVDVTEVDNPGGDINTKKIQNGLLASGIENAGGWILVIILALGLSMLGIAGAGSADVAKFLSTNPIIGKWVLPLFLFAIVSFMLSSVDGFISAIAYVAHYDLAPYIWSNEGRPDRGGIHLPRGTTLISVSSMYVLFMVIKAAADSDTAQVLYAIYAVQLSIAVVIGCTVLCPRYLKVIPAILSILFGWAISMVIASSQPVGGISEASWAVLPPLAVFVGSLIVYVLCVNINLIINRIREGKH